MFSLNYRLEIADVFRNKGGDGI